MPKPNTKGKNVFGQLEKIKKGLPVQKKPVNPPVGFVRAPKTPIRTGAKILRPVKFFTNGDSDILNPNLATGKEGGIIFRADEEHVLFTKHQVVGDPKLPNARVCVCRQEIPTDWIYFEVKGFGTSGKVVFVEPVKGTKTDLLKLYSFKLRGKNYLREEKEEKS